MNIALTSPSDVVAVVVGNQVRVRQEAGRVALPGMVGAAEAPGLDEVLALAGDRSGTVMAPTVVVGTDPSTRVHLVSGTAPPAGGVWLDLDDLFLIDQPAGIAAAIRRGVAEFRGEVSRPAGRPPWYRQGWRAEADEWIDQRLAEVGLTRGGPSEAVAAWALSTVLRVPVGSAGEVFLKATADLFRAEPAITELLGRVTPGRVPELLGTDPGRAWMLMRPLPGAGTETPPAAGPGAATVLARIQVAMLDQLDALLAAGAADRRRDATVAGIRAVVEQDWVLRALTTEERRTARAILPWLVAEVDALAACGMPFSVGHGDLHLGNVAAAGGRVVLYDWTDAAVTFPALDVELLGESARGHGPATRRAYAEIWREVVGEAAVTEALRHTAVVNQAYQAVTYDAITRAVEPDPTAVTAGVVPRVLRRLGRRYAEATG